VTPIGYATLQIIPSLKGVSGEITKQLAAMPEVGTAAGKKIGKELEQGVAQGAEGAAGQVKTRLSERLGSQVGSVVGKGIGAGIKLGIASGAAAAAAAVGGIGIALTKGFDRLKSIDEATFKLKALGHSADETKQIMDNALASVKGTAFGLQDAATAAASAVAAGIKPGQDLTKYLKEVGDAAAVAGTNFTDMGAIFGKIQTSNKAYTDDLNQLADRGLPIFQWLQQEYGVTGDKLTEMVQKGEVDSAHFQDAIEKNIGGAAQKMGQSFDGAVDNLEASVARLGANFITAALGGDPSNALQGPTQAIGALTDKFDQIGAWVNAHGPEIHAFFIDVKDVAVQAANAVKDIATWLVENKSTAEALAGVFVGWKVVSALGEAATAAKGVATALGLIGPAATTAGAEASTALAGITAPAWLIALLAGGSAAASNAFNAWSDAHPEFQQHDAQGRPAGDPNSQVRSRANTTGVPTTPITGGGDTNAQRARRGLPPYDPTHGMMPHAAGGSILGPGSGTSDSIPALLSNGEHVWTADEVNKLGGQGAMYRLRGMVKSGLLDGFDSGGAVNPNPLLNILLGQGGQRDNWAEYGTYDPMQHMMMKRNMVGVDPSGLRTPGGGIFNSAMSIDTSNVSVSPAPKWGYDQWRLTFDDFADATTYQKGERDNPSFYKKQAQLKNDPLGGWLLGYAGGGAVGGSPINVDAFKRFASGISGGRYIRGGPPGLSGTDCSGAQSALANFLTGGSGRFATGSEGPALSSRGFQMGDPPPGITAYWIGWKNGGPGGGHTAGTIIDPKGGNVNVEMGGASGGGGYGGRAGGAAGFANRAWIALAGAIADGVTEDPRTPTDFSAAPISTPTSSGGGGFSMPSSLSGLSSFGLSGLGKGIGTTGSGSDLSLFGNAAASAVSGQASSLLGAFGIDDNPPILQAASQLLGGISIGGHGGSAAPLAANNNAMGTLPPDGMHGGRAGQAPGPVFNTNISAFDTTDAVAQWDRKKNQMVAAKLSAF
jgi:tape measure domain-containing protein